MTASASSETPNADAPGKLPRWRFRSWAPFLCAVAVSDSVADSCLANLDSLRHAGQYAQAVECAAGKDSLTSRDHHSVLQSLLLQNRMGMALAYGDSVLSLLAPDSPSVDSIRQSVAYLRDLTTRRTAPPKAPRRWHAAFEVAHEYESFQWKPEEAEWTETVESQMKYRYGLARSPLPRPSDYAILVGRNTSFEAEGSLAGTSWALRHRLSGSARLGILHEDSGTSLGVSSAAMVYALGLGEWELSVAPGAQWMRTDTYSRSLSGSLDWNRRAGSVLWGASGGGGFADYLVSEQKIFHGGVEGSFTKLAASWFARSSLSTGWMRRTGIPSRSKPVRTAWCDDIREGEAASADSITCYLDGNSDSVVPPHPFKGVSGYPFFADDPLRRGSWESSLRLGAMQYVRKEFHKGRWNVQGAVNYVLERSIDPVEWDNGFLGVSLGDSLFAFHDRSTGRVYIWEDDIHGRFLELHRRKEQVTQHTALLQLKLGLRVFSRNELFLSGMVSRTWCSLPAESDEYGYARWQARMGWNASL